MKAVKSNGKAAYEVRPPAQRPCKAQPKPLPVVDYPAGFFTALMRQHNWPPRFEPRLVWNEKRQAAAEVLRAGQGFDRNPLGLEGAKEHIERWKAEAAAAVRAGR